MKKLFSKHLLLLMLAILSAVSFTSCKDDKDDVGTGESRLVGTWVATEYEDGDYYVITLVLNKNGNGTMGFEDSYGDSETERISWTVLGDTLLSIRFNDGDSLTEPFTLSSDGKTLYWNDFSFKKK